MQDDWLEILGDITSAAAMLDKAEVKMTPILSSIQSNSESINPELKAMLEKEMVNLSDQRGKLDALKTKLKDIKI